MHQHQGLIPDNVVASTLLQRAEHLALHLDTLTTLDEDGSMSATLEKIHEIAVAIKQIGELIRDAGNNQSFSPPTPAAGLVPPWSPRAAGSDPQPELREPSESFTRVRSMHIPRSNLGEDTG